MKEIWRSIKNYGNCYKVSNFGRVLSLERKARSRWGNYRTVRKKVLVLSTGGHGYITVCLSKNNNRKTYRVHLLVWDAFGDKQRNGWKLLVDHKDADKANNHINNLQLLTNSENILKGYREDKKRRNREV